MKEMELKVIKTDGEYKNALAALQELLNLDPDPGTREAGRLELLSLLLRDYESKQFPFSAPDPVEAIKFRMEQLNYTQNDLANIVGLKSRASEILNRKRKLSLEMIRQLHERLHIPTDVLIQAY